VSSIEKTSKKLPSLLKHLSRRGRKVGRGGNLRYDFGEKACEKKERNQTVLGLANPLAGNYSRRPKSHAAYTEVRSGPRVPRKGTREERTRQGRKPGPIEHGLPKNKKGGDVPATKGKGQQRSQTRPTCSVRGFSFSGGTDLSPKNPAKTSRRHRHPVLMGRKSLTVEKSRLRRKQLTLRRRSLSTRKPRA